MRTMREILDEILILLVGASLLVRKLVLETPTSGIEVAI